MQHKVEICGVNTAKLKVLKSEEAHALLLRAKAGDMEAREKLISGNLRLVLSVIQRFANRGENADDLFQVGCIGLIKAIDNFNTDLDVKFSTYGVPMNISCRKSIGACEMTRKSALAAARKIVERAKISKVEKDEILNKLDLCAKELPFAKWTEAAIFDAFDQYIEDTGLHITLNTFGTGGLPSHPTIKSRFHMTAKEFRDTYYPLKTDLPTRSPYCSKTTEEWTARFVSEYARISPSGQNEYNKKRCAHTPCWGTIAKMNHTNSWNELLKVLKLQKCTSHGKALKVTSTSRSQRMISDIDVKQKCGEIRSITDAASDSPHLHGSE